MKDTVTKLRALVNMKTTLISCLREDLAKARQTINNLENNIALIQQSKPRKCNFCPYEQSLRPRSPN